MADIVPAAATEAAIPDRCKHHWISGHAPAGECWLRQWTIPIEPGVAAQLLLPWPMTPERWQQFWSVLEAMKPGLDVAGRGTPDGDTQ